MADKVTFDYSKALSFISEHEVDYMKKLAVDAKDLLVSKDRKYKKNLLHLHCYLR